jgi:hypothetical protein
MTNTKTYTGFLMDWLRAHDIDPSPSNTNKLSHRVSAAGYNVVKKALLNSVFRTHITDVPVWVLEKAMGIDTSPTLGPLSVHVKPTNGDRPDAVAQLRQLVSTLNVVVDQLEAERAVSNSLRHELARLSTRARSAMVVYGD